MSALRLSELNKLQLIELGLEIQNRIRQMDAAQNSVDHILAYYNVTLADIRGKKKNRELVKARIAIYYYLSTLKIARKVVWAFIGKDRTTLLYYDKQISNAKEFDRGFYQELKQFA
jgi:chromosomal replication initiation ATPase DnaA